MSLFFCFRTLSFQKEVFFRCDYFLHVSRIYPYSVFSVKSQVNRPVGSPFASKQSSELSVGNKTCLLLIRFRSPNMYRRWVDSPPPCLIQKYTLSEYICRHKQRVMLPEIIFSYASRFCIYHAIVYISNPFIPFGTKYAP